MGLFQLFGKQIYRNDKRIKLFNDKSEAVEFLQLFLLV